MIQKSALARCLFHIHLIRKDKIHDWVTSTEGVSTYRYFQKSVAGESTPKQHGLSLCILAVFDHIAKGDEEWKKVTVLEAPTHIHEFLNNTNYQPGDSDTALWMWYTYIYATEHDDLYDFEAFDDSEAVDNPDGSDDWDSLYKSGVTDVFELLGRFEQYLSVPYSSEAIGRRKGIQAIREYWRLKLNSKASDESTIKFIRDCEQKRSASNDRNRWFWRANWIT